MSTLQDLLTEELRDLYDAEKQLVKALPKMAKAAGRPDLKKVFDEHTNVTRAQVERLEQIFALIDERPRSKPCKGMKGLVEEGQEVMSEHAGDDMLDSAMIGAAQRVEHYEIAGYTSAKEVAETLGLRKAAQLLDKTLKEEQQADQKLSQVSAKIMKVAAKEAASAAREESAGRGRSAKGGSGNGNRSRQAASARSEGNGRSRTAARGGRQTGSAKSAMTTDHEQIREWAQERGAEPACVRGTGKRGDTGLLRFDFPGYSGEESLQHISWEEFFQKFDESNLALLYQPQASGGKKSNFNKLVSRES